MKINRAYKTELQPTPKQAAILSRHAGAVRWVYNWGLAQKIAAYEAKEKSPSAFALDARLRSLKDTDDAYSWLKDLPAHPRQAALANVDTAYKNFFDRLKKGKRGKRAGFPKFKSRKRGDRVGIRHYSYTIKESSVRLPGCGWVKLKENGYLPRGSYKSPAPGARFFGMTVTERAGRWFVSVQVEVEIPDVVAAERPRIGVDVGIKSLAVVSDGRTFDNPRATGRFQRKLRRAQKRVSRRQVGSKNREKARREVARVHFRLSCVRSDALHKTSHAITREPSVIAIETLNVAGMVKNRRLAKVVSDASMSELHRQIKYKAQWRGSVIVDVDRWEPTSKRCSGCGCIKNDLTLADRVYKCTNCGQELDRDLNAARNLAKLAGSYSDSQNACGDGSSESVSIDSQPVDESGIPACAGNGGRGMADGTDVRYARGMADMTQQQLDDYRVDPVCAENGGHTREMAGEYG